jgi:hypothetical protein
MGCLLDTLFGWVPRLLLRMFGDWGTPPPPPPCALGKDATIAPSEDDE